MTTFDTHLSRLLRGNAGRPLVTFYDDATGERTELSVTTYANWVAKTASLFAEELDLERGQRLRIDLPPHWLGTVALGAAWTLGLVVTEAPDPDAVLCGPDTLSAWVDRAGDLVVVASALHPMATRFAEGVPAGVHDLGVEVWSQPDAFTAWDPPTGADLATDDLTQEQLWGDGGGGGGGAPARRPRPQRGEPGFPFRFLLLHRAARGGGLGGPGGSRRTGAAGGDLRRRARYGPLPLVVSRPTGAVSPPGRTPPLLRR